jgi:hypothetical protein
MWQTWYFLEECCHNTSLDNNISEPEAIISKSDGNISKPELEEDLSEAENTVNNVGQPH